MNSFDNFILSGANKARYIPIIGNARAIIGIYRKSTQFVVPGQTPLFLLDGNLSDRLLARAVDRLKLTKYVIIHRPFIDLERQKQIAAYRSKFNSCGWLGKDGVVTEYLAKNVERYRTTNCDLTRDTLGDYLRGYFEYEQILAEYNADIAIPPIDKATGEDIVADLNEYLFGKAKSIFPLGVESLMESNIKQSAIPKPRFFMDGMNNDPAPKGICRQRIGNTVADVLGFSKNRMEQDGAAILSEIITYCADIGLYKGNVTLYVIGAVFREFVQNSTVLYDGANYFCYAEVKEISSKFLQIWDVMQTNKQRRTDFQAAIFFDNTGLKERLRWIFGINETHDKQFDTLGIVRGQIIAWIVDNLRYPIAFLDDILYRLLWANPLYGEKLQEFSAYFTHEHCVWLKECIHRADAMARQKIEELVGFDLNETPHGMSNLSKGHYAPALYSAERYIEAMLNMDGRILP